MASFSVSVGIDPFAGPRHPRPAEKPLQCREQFPMHANAAPACPGWPEIIVGLACLSVVALGGGVGLVRPGMDRVPLGLILAALSGVGGMAVS